MSGASSRHWTGRQVLVALLLFFGVVAAANGVMIWFALVSWPGRSPADAQRHGWHPPAAAVRVAIERRAVPWMG